MSKSVSPSRPPPTDTRPGNKLLACLPAEDFARIKPHLKTITMKARQIIHRRNEAVRDIVFPNGGVISVTTVMNDGAMVEVATIGHEGLVGISVLFGGEMMSAETMVQVPDTSAETMSAEAFTQEFARGGAFHECVQRYCQGLLTLMMQSTACMALHPVHERCCRWLLMAHDRIRRDEFELSHEFLAMMLGSTRPTVTVVAGTLQKAGLIRYRHGHVTILDRPSLEDASCECYATVKANFERLRL